MKKIIRCIITPIISMVLCVSLCTPITARAEDGVTAFVRRLYQLCLDREPDSGGLNNWVNALNAKTRTASQVVQSFFLSKEMMNRNLSDEEYIERCYLVMLDRHSDESGRQTWLNARATGVSYDYLLHGFTGSQEFIGICRNFGIDVGRVSYTEFRDMNLSLTAFVQRLYSNILGRTADTGGLNYWCNKIILRAMTPKYVATNGFFHSKEYLSKNTDNSSFVITCYKTFLDRDYDTNGYNYWMNRLNNGESRDTILAGFADSKEFQAIIEKSGWQNNSTYQQSAFCDVTTLLVVANKKHKLPSGYQPSDLRVPNVPMNQTVYLRTEAASALERMFAAAKTAGVTLIAGSGFRSESLQATLYNGYCNSYGSAIADTISSRAGYSDHQTGLAMDISDHNGATYLTQAMENTPEGKWLRDHAHEYGFIMRYPKGKDAITGYSYEPWHFRYVGVDVATAIYNVGVWESFEEYFNVPGGDYN